MTSRQKNTLSGAERQAAIHELLQEQMRLNIRMTFITVLEEEVNGFIQAALYQRTPERQDYRNGHYERDLVTTVGKLEDLPVPRTRDGFHTQLFEHYRRRQAELDEAICNMFVQGCQPTKCRSFARCCVAAAETRKSRLYNRLWLLWKISRSAAGKVKVSMK